MSDQNPLTYQDLNKALSCFKCKTHIGNTGQYGTDKAGIPIYGWMPGGYTGIGSFNVIPNSKEELESGTKNMESNGFNVEWIERDDDVDEEDLDNPIVYPCSFSIGFSKK